MADLEAHIPEHYIDAALPRAYRFTRLTRVSTRTRACPRRGALRQHAGTALASALRVGPDGLPRTCLEHLPDGALRALSVDGAIWHIETMTNRGRHRRHQSLAACAPHLRACAIRVVVGLCCWACVRVCCEVASMCSRPSEFDHMRPPWVAFECMRMLLMCSGPLKMGVCMPVLRRLTRRRGLSTDLRSWTGQSVSLSLSED
ncbi:hypothetical protein K523DRAFT_139150 [Schizophyllum commune Tattone D]|nr:hypothetical protein K523DRAFT_139150 [Schizophyllum commune Tattone D]